MHTTRIKSIKKLKIKKVYDFKVPNYFNFILGNNIIVHNCGKSTLAYKVLSRLNCKIPFNPRKDICYSREDVVKALANKKHGCVLADELINAAYNRDFWDEDQKVLLKAFNMYRDSCNIFIGCVPKFVTVDTQMQQLCKLRITVIRRGIAILHMPKPSIYSKDKWDTKTNQKLEDKWGRRGIKKPRYAQLTTVVGILHFKDIGKKQRKLYESIKERKRGKVFSKYADDDLINDPNQQFYDRLIVKVIDKKLTIKELHNICFIAGKKYKTVREKLNNMLKEKGITTPLKELVLLYNSNVKKDTLGFKTG